MASRTKPTAHDELERLRSAASVERVKSRDIESRLAVAERTVEAAHGETIEALATGDERAVARAREAAEQQATQAGELQDHAAAAHLRIQRTQQAADDYAHDNADALLAECQVEVERVTTQLSESVGVVLEHHRALVEQTRELDRIISAGGGEPRLDGPPSTHAWQVALHELGRTVQAHPVLEAPRPRWRGREAAAQRDAVAQAIQDQRKAA